MTGIVEALAAPSGEVEAPLQDTEKTRPESEDEVVFERGTMEELRKKAPQFYQKMLEGIGWTICRESRKSLERQKKVWRENRSH